MSLKRVLILNIFISDLQSANSEPQNANAFRHEQFLYY